MYLYQAHNGRNTTRLLRRPTAAPRSLRFSDVVEKLFAELSDATISQVPALRSGSTQHHARLHNPLHHGDGLGPAVRNVDDDAFTVISASTASPAVLQSVSEHWKRGETADGRQRFHNSPLDPPFLPDAAPRIGRRVRGLGDSLLVLAGSLDWVCHDLVLHGLPARI